MANWQKRLQYLENLAAIFFLNILVQENFFYSLLV